MSRREACVLKMTRRTTRWLRGLGVWFLVFGVWLGGLQAGEAGPWTKSLGQFYGKLNQGFFFADSFIDAEGILQQGSDYLGATSSIYFEGGLLPERLGAGKLQVVLLLPYLISRNAFGGGSWYMHGAFADSLFGLQYSAPVKLPIRLGVRLEAKIPLYDNDRLNRAVGGVRATKFPAVGDGQLDFTGWLTLGGGIPKLPLYAFVELGYRHRTEVYTGTKIDDRTFIDNLVVFAQVGWTFYRNMIFMVTLNGVIPLGSDVYTKGSLSISGQFYIPIGGGWAIEASYDPLLWARNSAQSLGVFSFGISFAR